LDRWIAEDDQPTVEEIWAAVREVDPRFGG